MKSDNSLRLSALRDCRYALVVLHDISAPLLQFGEVEGEAQSETQEGRTVAALNRRRRAQCDLTAYVRTYRQRTRRVAIIIVICVTGATSTFR